MSILIYINKSRDIVLATFASQKRSLIELSRWPAHNEVASTSKGHWPTGLYRYSHFNAHQEAGMLPGAAIDAFGGTGIHVFTVLNRSGMGIHAGRSMNYDIPGGKTLGCVRVTTTAMLAINERHRTDPLSHIYVANTHTTEAYKPMQTLLGAATA